MTHCETPATRYDVTKEDGQKSVVYECDQCHTRRTPLVHPVNGAVTWAWMPKAGYCAECRHPIWRFATDPKTGQPLHLWPGPDVVSVKYSRPDGGFYQPVDYCAQCAPALGTTPRRPIMAGAVPLPIVACVEHVPLAERYAEWFTDHRGAERAAWAKDHLHLGDEHHEQFVAQWAADRVAILQLWDEAYGVATAPDVTKQHE